MKSRLAGAVLTLLAFSALDAQYPGQYPPGQYPPGQGPTGQTPGGGLSIPRRHKKGADKGGKDAENALPTIAADGYTLSRDEKKLVIATDDGRTITMTVDSKTAFLKDTATIPPSKIAEGSFVHIEAAEDDEAYLTAVKVSLLKDSAPESAPRNVEAAPKESAPPVDPKLAAELSRPAATDAPDRPVLRRGRPAGRNEFPEDEPPPAPPPSVKAAKPATAAAAKKDSGDFTITSGDFEHQHVAGDDEQIQRSKDWAETFTQGLPNYICQQVTTRYQEESRSAGWTPIDVVTAKIVFENGHEDYRDITVGGKRTNKSMLEIGGTHSTGEFAGYLRSLFIGDRAQFKFYQSTSVTRTPVAIYDFIVPLKRSDWSIVVGGQTLRPQYSGAVWVEKASGQVRRIEFQADNAPKDFPFDSAQTAVDYEPIHLGTAIFLLPVHAEGIICQRGTSICTKNEIDFRDYHKYAGESTIVYK
jgi:hypothetical protein